MSRIEHSSEGRTTRVIALGAFCALWSFILAPTPAAASFHLNQIEQVIAGVGGDTTAQAIQLRMRAGGQTFLSYTRLKAYDANGANPVLLVDFTRDVPNGLMGERVLIASSGFAKYTGPALQPDFTLTNLIPASYLAAGRLTFEDGNGGVYWSLSFGGAAYVGSNAGAFFNDPSGDFGPPFPGPLPSSDLHALRFTGPPENPSTSNAADYALTPGAAVFTNNARESATVTLATPQLGVLLSVNQPTFAVGDTLTATLGLTDPGVPGSFDAYLGLLRPDGSIQFFTSGGIALGSVTDLGSFRPLVTGIPLPSPFSVTVPGFYTYPWTGGEQHGNYVFFLLVLEAGALSDGIVAGDEVLGIATAPFSFP